MMDATAGSYSTPCPAGMRYIRAYLGGGDESPVLMLYEVDPKGVVHRHVEVTLEGARFAPEDLLLLGPLDTDALIVHRGAEEIDGQAFDALWQEIETSRRFRAWIPDPASPQTGRVVHGDKTIEVRWSPDCGLSPRGMARVPGFQQLFVAGGRPQARAVQTALFLGAECEWDGPCDPWAEDTYR